jgi:tetratricopeptide (TPR) repeat protein
MGRVGNINATQIIRLLLVSVFLVTDSFLFAQSDKKLIRKGNREYDKDKYQESEVLYRKAAAENKQSPDAVFNTGDALYKQKKYEDAGKQFEANAGMTMDASRKAAGYYNLGNSMLQANKLKESIEAYKNSLKIDPENNAAKYNLGYAQSLLKKQEQQQQQQQQQQNQDQNKDQDKKDPNKEQDQKNDQNKDQQQQQQNEKQQKQEQPGISKDDAQRLLDALANDEKNVQEKVKRDKAARARVRSLRNW